MHDNIEQHNESNDQIENFFLTKPDFQNSLPK